MSDWQDHAACQYLRTEDAMRIFFESELEFASKYDYPFESEAKFICSTCPVKHNCLDYAMLVAEPWGIMGGMTFPERRKLARKRLKNKDFSDKFFYDIIDDFLSHVYN
jgi:WhiB family redox-sensing transcriptional regulator